MRTVKGLRDARDKPVCICCAFEARKQSEKESGSRGRGQLEALINIQCTMKPLPCPSVSPNMEVNYIDESDTSLARLPQRDSTSEQVQWDELQDYIGSSDEDDKPKDHLLDLPHDRFRGCLICPSHTYDPEHLQNHDRARSEDRPQQMLEVRSLRWASLERFESSIAETSVGTYEDDDVQWWHYFVGDSQSEWDEVQVIAFIAFMFLVCFVGAATVWVIVN